MLACFCFFPALAAASKPNLLLGQRIGETLWKMDPGDASAVQAELMSEQKALNNPAVLETISKMNGRVGGELGDVCDRDYEAPCPISWRSVASKCLAPKSYTGGCKRMEALDAMDEMQKRQWVEKCNANWPCKDSIELFCLLFERVDFVLRP